MQISFIVGMFFIQKNSTKKISNLKIAFFSSVFFYVSIVVIAFATKEILRSELNSYDLNGDGFFSGSEINEGQQKAMHKFISDTGRNLAPIFGIVYAIIYFVILFVVFKIVSSIKPR